MLILLNRISKHFLYLSKLYSLFNIDNNQEINYNENYNEELTLEKLKDFIMHEKNHDLKEFYYYL